MGNIIYDLADNTFNTEYVVETVVNILKEKYDRDFEVVKIGERYGMGFNDEVTLMCTVTGHYECIFKVVYNMVLEKIVYDNFMIRCTCYYVEKEINRLLRSVNSIVRVEILKKNSVNKVYKTLEFLEEFQDECFVATLVVEHKDSNNIEAFLRELNGIYNGIKIQIISYEMSDEEYNRFYEDSKNLDYFSLSYVESYEIISRKIYSLEKGNVTSY